MMPEKKSYFVSLDKQTITRVSVPDTTEYEVLLNSAELTMFKALISNYDDGVWSTMENIVFKPFDENNGDLMSKQEDDNLIEVYHYMYRYGTDATRTKLAEIGFRDE